MIQATYLDGPFSHLENERRFSNQETGEAGKISNVHFKIDCEFKSRTLSMLMGSMFDRAYRKFAEAF